MSPPEQMQQDGKIFWSDGEIGLGALGRGLGEKSEVE
jgi:hypothetical protein